MAAETLDTLNGYFKKRYLEDRPPDLVPEFSDFALEIKFDERSKLGDSFNFPVRVRRAQGATYFSSGDDATLNTAIPGKTVLATVSAQSYVIRDQISYDVAASATGNMDAFGDAFDEIVRDLENTMAFHREISILYGQSSLGTFEGAGSSAATVSYDLTKASSAIGMCLQMEGAPVDVYDPTLVTKRNTNSLTVGSVSLGTDGQTVSLSLTGDAADNAAVQAGDVFVPKGWVSGSMTGIDKICTNTGSLFGISASTYGLWKANTVDAGSAELTMLTLTRAAAVQVQRSGRKGKKLKAFVSFATWNDLNNNAAALRRFAESTKSKLDIGSMEGITYYGPGVIIEVVPSGIVKNGEAFLGEWSSVKRVGACDAGFNLPGASPDSGKFFHHLQDKAAYEIRGYWKQAVIPLRPACLTKITGIVNSV